MTQLKRLTIALGGVPVMAQQCGYDPAHPCYPGQRSTGLPELIVIGIFLIGLGVVLRSIFAAVRRSMVKSIRKELLEAQVQKGDPR